MTSPSIRCVSLDEAGFAERFAGLPAERDAAVNELYEACKHCVAAFIRNRFPGLSSDGLASAVQDTFIGFRRSLDRHRFDSQAGFLTHLFLIARRRGIDELRKETGRTWKLVPFDEQSQELLESADIGRDWTDACEGEGTEGIASLFREMLAKLPRIQRQIAQVMADFFPHQLSLEEICDELCKRTGRLPSRVQVKSARAHVRRKFKIALKRGRMLNSKCK